MSDRERVARELWRINEEDFARWQEGFYQIKSWEEAHERDREEMLTKADCILALLQQEREPNRRASDPSLQDTERLVGFVADYRKRLLDLHSTGRVPSWIRDLANDLADLHDTLPAIRVAVQQEREPPREEERSICPTTGWWVNEQGGSYQFPCDGCGGYHATPAPVAPGALEPHNLPARTLSEGEGEIRQDDGAPKPTAESIYALAEWFDGLPASESVWSVVGGMTPGYCLRRIARGLDRPVPSFTGNDEHKDLPMDAELVDVCPECGHAWEYHGPDVPGCIECKCSRLRAQSTPDPYSFDAPRHKWDGDECEACGMNRIICEPVGTRTVSRAQRRTPQDVSRHE